MKNILLIITNLLIGLQLVSQSIMFNKGYDNDHQHETFTSILVLSDGYITMGPSPDLYLGNGEYYIVKTDFTGEVIWEKVYGGTIYSFLGGDIIKVDNGFVIFQTRYNVLTGDGDFHLVKIDDEGNLIWEREFGTNAKKQGAVHVISTLEGGLMLVGFEDKYPDELGDLYLVKTNNEGILEWEKRYGVTNKVEGGKDIIQTADGGYLVLGIQANNMGDVDIWLLKIDSLGNEQWDITHGGNYWDEGTHFIEVADGYLIAGITYPDFVWQSSGDSYLLKVDFEGNFMWDRVYALPGPDSFKRVYELPDGRLMLLGSETVTDNGLHNGSLLQLTAEGDSLWSRSYSNDGLENGIVEYLWDFKPTPDGGYVMCGQTHGIFPDSNQDAWIVKVDSLGNTCTTANCDSTAYPVSAPSVTQPQNLTISPNPFSISTQITLPAATGKTHRIELYDLMGRKVRSHDFSGTLFRLQRGDLSAGVYLYRLWQGATVLESGKLVVE